jgi:hypothetical protein
MSEYDSLATKTLIKRVINAENKIKLKSYGKMKTI